MSTDDTASSTRIERGGGALAPDERRLALGSSDEAASVGRERWRRLKLLIRYPFLLRHVVGDDIARAAEYDFAQDHAALLEQGGTLRRRDLERWLDAHGVPPR